MADETWPNRVTGSGTVDPNELLENPANWRAHPRFQADAMKGALEQVGWVSGIIVNRSTGFIVDGHMRVSLAVAEEQVEVPVQYVELTAEEEAVILATFDPIGGLAVTDAQALGALAERASIASTALSRTVTELLGDTPTKAAPMGGGAPAAGAPPAENALSWGYATFGQVRVNCSASEIDALQAAFEEYRDEHGGLDTGFVRWLAEGRADEG